MEIYRYDALSSTNSELLELSKKNAKSWTVVWTSHQTAGKGYAGSNWVSEKDRNVAVSVLIKSVLKYDELIYFNQWISVVLFQFLSQFSNDLWIKWPNDIILKNKKIAGILIETHKADNELNIILGVGLNVNQLDFGSLPKAGSLASELHRKFNLEEILSGFMTELENAYSEIDNKNWESIRKSYNKHLFRLNQVSTFIKNQIEFQGIIREVDGKGRLVIENLEDKKINAYQHKEIELKY